MPARRTESGISCASAVRLQPQEATRCAAPSGSVRPSVSWTITGSIRPQLGLSRRRARTARRRTRRGRARRRRAARRGRRRRALPTRAPAGVWISGSGSSPGRRLQDRPAQLEGVVGELEPEEARLPLLELRGRGQHVVGQPRGLGHRDVDHDEQVELLERLAHPRRVGERVRGVGALDDHRAQAAAGRSVRISSAIELPGISPVMIRSPRDRRLGVAAEVAAELAMPRVDVHRPRAAEVAGQQEQQLLEVGVERRVRRLLDAEVLEDRDARGLRDAAARSRARGPRRRRSASAVLGDRHARELGEQRARRRVACAARKSSSSSSSSTSTASSAARQKASVPGPHLQMEVGQRGGLRAARIDHDQRARRILGDLLEDDARAREAVRLPRVLADEHRDLGALEVRRGVTARAAEQLTVDPELAGLLLRQRVRHVADAERGARRRRIRAAEVVGLPAAAVVEDRLAAVLVADRAQPLRRSRAIGGVPVDRLERAVRPARAAGRRAGRGRSGSGRAAAPSRTRSRASAGWPCRRGCSTIRPSSTCTSIPQLRLQRMQAVFCHSEATA